MENQDTKLSLALTSAAGESMLEETFLYVSYLIVLGICSNFSAEWVLYRVPGILHLLHVSGSQKFCLQWCFCMYFLPFKESESIGIIRLTNTCFKMLDELNGKNVAF